MCETESVLDMAYANRGAVHQHADHVEPVRLRFPSVPVYPDHRGTLQLLALAIVDRLHRSSEVRPLTSLNFDKSDRALPLDDQIDVAMAAAEATLNHAPAAPPKPPLRDSLSKLSECLPGR